jgi:GTPase SAR1 family protein
LGNSGCGKSSLLLRYVDDSYTDEFVSTIGVDFKEKWIQKNEEKIRLQVNQFLNHQNNLPRFGTLLGKTDTNQSLQFTSEERAL